VLDLQGMAISQTRSHHKPGHFRSANSKVGCGGGSALSFVLC
jgi:hypothetical protein